MKGTGKMSKKKKIIIGVSVLIVICIVITLAIIFNRKDDTENNNQNNYTNIDKENELSYQPPSYLTFLTHFCARGPSLFFSQLL